MSAADDREKRQRLAAQWPKTCNCCHKVYDRRIHPGDPLPLDLLNPRPWRSLEFAYTHRDAYSTQEARHCSCGTTLVVDVEIHDLKEE